MEKMDSKRGLLIPGLYPTGINIFSGRFTDAVCRLGAMGDSWFEYLLKQYLLVDGSMPQYSRMCKLDNIREPMLVQGVYNRSLSFIFELDLESIDALKKYVFSFIPGNDMIFVPPFDTLSKSRHITMDHLVRWKVKSWVSHHDTNRRCFIHRLCLSKSCFVPGMLALGSKTFDRPEELTIAKGTLEACMHLYRTSDTGLGAEMWTFAGGEPYESSAYQTTLDRLGNNNQQSAHHDHNYKVPPRPSRVDQVRVIDGKYHLRPGKIGNVMGYDDGLIGHAFDL